MGLSSLLLLSALAGSSPDNDGAARPLLADTLLPDLRVFVDLAPGDMPRNPLDGDLPAAEVREAVHLGLANWAGVLPGMRFALVDSAGAANLVISFRDYGKRLSQGATAESFRPAQWARSGNAIRFQSRGLAFRRVHFRDARMHHEYLGAKADRSRRRFRFLPDPKHNAWPPDRATCVTGTPRLGVLPVFDPMCLEDGDWRALPHYDAFGPGGGPYDIASLVTHEFGHALLGGHTGESGRCARLLGDGYGDFARDPVYVDSLALRRLEWRRPDGTTARSYSTLFYGNGCDAAWNIRGLFEADGARLAGGALDWECRPTGEWKGYATTYPRVNGWIVLQKPGGETRYVDDWGYAHRLMGWPSGRDGKPRPAEWFQTGLILR